MKIAKNSLNCFSVILIFIYLFGVQCWSGIYDDSCPNGECYGGVMFVCTSGNTIYGKYSNIGYFVGNIVEGGVRAIGTWYEGGFSLYNNGGFDWYLDSKGINGSWWYLETKCLRNSWVTPILNPGEPSNCGDIILEANGGNIEGNWISQNGDKLSICQQTTTFFQSFGTILGENIIYYGEQWQTGRVSTASYWRNPSLPINQYSQPQGITLMYVDTNSRLQVYMYDVPNSANLIGTYYYTNETNPESDPSSFLHYVFERDSNVTDLNCSPSSSNNTNSTETLSDYTLNWAGIYTDPNHGKGYLYLCLVPGSTDLYQGIFSELGWLEGQASGDSLTGLWYTSDGERGEFKLDFSNDGLFYDGFMIKDSGHETNWKGARLDITSGYLQDRCYMTTQQNSAIEGQWYYGKSSGKTLDICVVGDNLVEVSYTYLGGKQSINGYGLGYITDDNKSMQLIWSEKRATGFSMFRLTEPDVLVESFWAKVDTVADIEYSLCNNGIEVDVNYWGLHNVLKLTRLSDQPNPTRCRRNRARDYISSSSDASTIPISVLLIILSSILCLSFSLIL